jgi:hypothetical protein
MKRLSAVMGLVLLIAFAFPITAFASDISDGRVVLGGTYRLESGEVLDGDLAIIGGAAFLEEESRVAGDVIVLGGNLDVYGQIDGEVIIIGGNVNLGPAALIKGDVATLGGNLNANASQIEGEMISGTDFVIPYDFDNLEFEFDQLTVPPIPAFGMSVEARVLSYLFVSFLMTALAVMVMLFWPNNTRTAAEVIVKQPVASGGMGLLTVFVVMPVLTLLVVTVCLIPVSLFGFLIFGLAWVFGVVALGYQVGDRLEKALNQDFQPVLSAGLGTLVLALVVGGIGFIPCIGFLISLLVGVFGLGAVLLTRFGTRTYPYIETDFVTASVAEDVKSLPEETSDESEATKKE